MNIHNEDAQAGLAVFLFLVLCGLVTGGIYMLDSFGLVNVQAEVSRYLSETPYVGQFVQRSGISQEEYKIEKLRKLQNKVEQKRSKLQQKRQELDERENELKQQRRSLNRTEENLESREQALAERKTRFEDKENRAQYLANLYSNMPPDASAARLESIEDDQIVISILRKMETSTSSIILSSMNPNRSAQLTRKMANYPGG